jgi:hypothetical protein
VQLVGYVYWITKLLSLVLSYFHFMAFPVKMFAAEFPVYGLVFEVGS